MLRSLGVAILMAGLLVGGAFAAPLEPATVGVEAQEEVWRAVLEGGVDRFRHQDRGNDVVVEGSDRYRTRVEFTFTVPEDGGFFQGQTTGTYTFARWHIEGTNGDQGPILCDVPLVTAPFTVGWRGTAVRVPPVVTDFGVFLFDAREVNEEYPCPDADFVAFASNTEHLADSLLRVMNDGISFNLENPVIPVLTRREDERSDDNRMILVVEDYWTLTITPPGAEPTPQPPPRSVPPAGPLPPPPRVPPARPGGCTLRGTPGNDVLEGTIGNDSICGLGGNDTLRGNGGNDAISGGPGNDTISGGPGQDLVFGNSGRDRFRTKDGERDRINGGPGRDRATVDQALDRVLNL